MSKQTTSFSFGNERVPSSDFVLYDRIIEDRGSVYSVSVGRVQGREDIKLFLKRLKQDKKYAKATHNTFAARISHEGAMHETKSDDGEVGAGMTILREMQRANVSDCVVCVTRWFGGVKLMGDRFKHVQDATRHALSQL